MSHFFLAFYCTRTQKWPFIMEAPQARAAPQLSMTAEENHQEFLADSLFFLFFSPLDDLRPHSHLISVAQKNSWCHRIHAHWKKNSTFPLHFSFSHALWMGKGNSDFHWLGEEEEGEMPPLIFLKDHFQLGFFERHFQREFFSLREARGKIKIFLRRASNKGPKASQTVSPSSSLRYFWLTHTHTLVFIPVCDFHRHSHSFHGDFLVTLKETREGFFEGFFAFPR